MPWAEEGGSTANRPSHPLRQPPAGDHEAPAAPRPCRKDGFPDVRMTEDHMTMYLENRCPRSRMPMSVPPEFFVSAHTPVSSVDQPDQIQIFWRRVFSLSRAFPLRVEQKLYNICSV